ncbi:MAG: hypothetical protein WCA01_11915, partial [Burkholderiales bacterium]
SVGDSLPQATSPATASAASTSFNFIAMLLGVFGICLTFGSRRVVGYAFERGAVTGRFPIETD